MRSRPRPTPAAIDAARVAAEAAPSSRAARVAEAMLRMQEAWRTCSWTVGIPRWDILESALQTEPDDQEAWAYVAEMLDPARCARAKGARIARQREERAEAAYERQGVGLEDLAHRGKAAIERAARGKSVWLYHGTSSLLLKGILQLGLRIGDAKVDPTETPGVYLTALPGRGHPLSGAAFYARRAAATLGGDPVVLRVLAPFDDLEWDTDDEDIATGNWQFVTDYIPPEAILEVDGERRVLPKKKAPRRPRGT